MIKQICLSLCVVVIGGCANQSGFYNEGGIFVPERELSPKGVVSNPADSLFIDTLAIYEAYLGEFVIGQNSQGEPLLQKQYNVYSFFPNGLVCVASIRHSLIEGELNLDTIQECDLCVGIGEYTLTDSTVIDMRLFEWKETGKGEYVRYKIELGKDQVIRLYKILMFGEKSWGMEFLKTDVSRCPGVRL